MSDHPEDFTEFEGGPERAPRSVLARLVRLFITLFVLVVGGTLIVVLADQLPQGTQTSSLVIRAVIALSIGAVLIFVVRRMLGAMAGAPPAPPRTVDARSVDVAYVCPVCGTRVRLEVAATAKAPRHCGEEMESNIG